MEKKNNSFGVLFYLKKYKQQGGRSPVYVEGKEFAPGTVERYETSFRHAKEFL